MKAYDKKHRFTIIKKQLGQHKDGNIKHRSFGCEFSDHYWPKKHINVKIHRDCKLKCQQCT